MDEAKPFKIPKREVWEAFKRVKANQGALILPERHPACRRREARPGFRMERENLCLVTPTT